MADGATERVKTLAVAEAAPSRRRAFMKRAGLAALGAAAAAPVVGAKSARAAGTQVAYQDAPNTFTADQTVQAWLGVGTVPFGAPLHVVRQTAGAALRVDAHTMALQLAHDTDWQGQTYDLVNLTHTSAGDAIFIAHQGGVPPNYSGPPPGGRGGVNVLIPYTRDDTGGGRGGSVVNDYTGARGLYIEMQAVVEGSRAIEIQHFGHAYGMYMITQPPNYGQPVGRGGAIFIDDYSNQPSMIIVSRPQGTPDLGEPSALRIHDYGPVSTLRIDKFTAPSSSNDAMLSLYGRVSDPVPAILVRDNSYQTRFWVRNDGWVRTSDAAGSTLFETRPDGTVTLASTVSGVSRSLALVNRDSAVGSGAQLEFDDSNQQYATIKSTYDNRNSGSRAASLSFQVRSSDNLTERLRLNATGIGFFGVAPVARPTVTGAKKNIPALASLLSALSRLGLVVDSTTG